jgi:hypothetical protein
MSRAIAPRSRNGIEGHCDPVRDRMPFDDLQRSLQVVPAHRVSLVLDRGADGKQVTPDVIDVGQTSPGHVLVMRWSWTAPGGFLPACSWWNLASVSAACRAVISRTVMEDSGNTAPAASVGPTCGQQERSRRQAAPSVPRRPDINARIAAEIYIALERLDAGPELLAIVGGWRDTLPDADVLRLLREYNAGQPTLQPRQ